MRIATIRRLMPFLGLAVLFLAIGCGHSLDDYYPLQVGSVWTYKTTYVHSGDTTEHQDRIVGRKGSTYNFADGHKLTRFPVSIAEENGADLIRTPLRKGKRWRFQDVRMEIRDTRGTATVPAGTYSDCLVVAWWSVVDGVNRLTVTTYAPSVGPALIEYYAVPETGDADLLLRSELVRFEPAG